MAEVGKRNVGENGSDDCVSWRDWLYGRGREMVVVMGCYGDDAIYSMLSLIIYHISCDNLCCNIASENSIRVVLVALGVKRHALSLHQFTSLISKLIYKMEANSLSQRRTR